MSLGLLACGAPPASYVHTADATLGRVVVYRNGIAYFERTAHVEGDTLKLSVPADKIDDFLKSLTVVDAKTGEPTPISYPTSPTASGTGLIDLEIKLSGASPHDVKLSYVSEAPSWKPSYRVVLGDGGKVSMEGWAVVDNTSGEDWEHVRLGVGSSSALAFKYDLKSVRTVARDTLHADDLFAVAPPIGGSLYGGDARNGELAELSDGALADKLARAEAATAEKNAPRPVATASPPMPSKPTSGPKKKMAASDESYALGSGRAYSGAPASAAPYPDSYGGGGYGGPMPSAPPPPPSDDGFADIATRLKSSGKSIVIEGFATETDGDPSGASLERANKLREQLVKRGVAPEKVVAVGKGLVAGHRGGVRVVDGVGKDAGKVAADPTAESKDPIGTSHFESKTEMTVKRSTSAMVSILKGPTDGEVVYFYDPDSARGNASFPFRALRLTNPTDSTLESGPMTVFGEGKFIGEGISEPIPPHASAFVPFALDRQIVVDNKGGERDEVARIISVQRGVFSTEVKHWKTTKLVLHNRTPGKVRVAIRHNVPNGFELEKKGFSVERIGSSYVLSVEVDGNAQKEVSIEESTPVFKTIDLRSPQGLEMVKLYASSDAVRGPLREAIASLVKLSQESANLEQRVELLRDQMAAYRTRVEELHGQIFTLKAVKTGGPLMHDLEKKMSEMSDKLSKATLDLVNAQEQLMLSKIRFQDAISELTLEKAEPPKTTKSATGDGKTDRKLGAG
jgi:hypothetical protein